MCSSFWKSCLGGLAVDRLVVCKRQRQRWGDGIADHSRCVFESYWCFHDDGFCLLEKFNPLDDRWVGG